MKHIICTNMYKQCDVTSFTASAAVKSFWKNNHIQKVLNEICGVWCRGLTTCLLHVGSPFGNRLLNNSWAVGLT